MERRRLYLYDTTLRDGAQTTAVEFSVEQKRAIAQKLAEAGFPYIEGGFPGANPVDTALFADPGDLRDSRLVAFGMTKRKTSATVADDPLLTAVYNAGTSVCLVAKSSEFQVREALGLDNPEDYFAILRDSLNAPERPQDVMIDAEHFFDGFRENPMFALRIVQTAFDSGASWVTLCDTNGGSLPEDITEAVKFVLSQIPAAQGRLGIHCHNDMGLATANTLAAIRAGCTLVQGTINGLGERCGNADLLEFIPTLMLKKPYADFYDCGITPQALAETLPELRLMVYAFSGREPNPDDPYFGKNAFVTKAGIHASAVRKNPGTYEHIEPGLVGNRRSILFSRQGGISNLSSVLERFGIAVPANDSRLTSLYNHLTDLEGQGYRYAVAEASMELEARSVLHDHDYPLTIEKAEMHTTVTGKPTPSVGRLTVLFNEKSFDGVAQSYEGPFDALNKALQNCLTDAGVEGAAKVGLTDYKVHNLDAGTGSRVLVTISFATEQQGKKLEWTTMGLSENSQAASAKALADGYKWLLTRQALERETPAPVARLA